MNKFYFDTGVRVGKLFGNQVFRNGTIQIPFDADVPKDHQLMFLCNDPNLPESKYDNVVVVEAFSNSQLSRYAYFRKPFLKGT